jgi:hypothetical protein
MRKPEEAGLAVPSARSWEGAVVGPQIGPVPEGAQLGEKQRLLLEPGEGRQARRARKQGPEATCTALCSLASILRALRVISLQLPVKPAALALAGVSVP